MSRRSRTLSLAAALTVGVLIAAPAVTAAPGGNTAAKVTICHRTNSMTNPYVQITVAQASVDGDGGNDKGQGDHYLNHTGEVWTPDSTKAAGWGDIIPPIPGIHGGLNWSAAGQVIWENGCAPVSVPAAQSSDSDHDDIPDVIDPDDDNDGITDPSDPDSVSEETDTDGDHVPDGRDIDDDNDCVADSADADIDGDGVANAADADRDNDGLADAVDLDDAGDLVADLLDGDANGDELSEDAGSASARARLPRSGSGTADAGDGAPAACATPLSRVDDPTDELPNLPVDPAVVPGEDTPGETPGDTSGDTPAETTADTPGDNDADGTPDASDPDDDNDGVPDTRDGDADGDGTPETVEQRVLKDFALPETIAAGEETVLVSKAMRTDAGERVTARATCSPAARAISRTLPRGDVSAAAVSRSLCDVKATNGRLSVTVVSDAPTVVRVHLEAPATGAYEAWTQDERYVVR